MQAIRSGALTQLDTIEAAHSLGLDAIEFIDLCPIYGKTPSYAEQAEYALRLREEAERLGMTINAYTIGANLFCTGDDALREIERLCRQLDIAKTLGATVMRHDVVWNYSGGRGRSFDMMLPVIAENVRKVADYGKSVGVITCSENHGIIAQDSIRVEKLFSRVAHENFGLLVDIGNFECVDEDPVLAVSRVAPYAVHVHAKDFICHSFEENYPHGYLTRACRRLVGCAVGEGDVPVRRCISILKRAGYDGFVSIEYEGPGDPIDGIRRGIENLRTYI